MKSDLLDRIDDITTPVCAHCAGPLGGSPSDDFCRESCATDWRAGRSPCRLRSGQIIPRPYAWQLIRTGRGDRLSHDTMAALAAEVMEPIQTAVAEIGSAVQRAFQQWLPTVTTAHHALINAGVVSAPSAADPKGVALEARRNRNTGPRVHADPRRNRRR